MQIYWKMLTLEDVPEETIQKLTSLLDIDDDYLRYQAFSIVDHLGN